MITIQMLLSKMRKQSKVSQVSLAQGICSKSFLSRIESGERKAGKLLKDYLLGRLGITNKNYEDYLQPYEYKLWTIRQSAIYALLTDDTNGAEAAISEYECIIEVDDTISKQFVEYVRATILKMGGADIDVVNKAYEKSLKYTMSHMLNLPESGNDALLADREYCILIEYYDSLFRMNIDSSDSESTERYLDTLFVIAGMIESSGADDDEKVKVYPYAVKCYCEGVLTFDEKKYEKKFVNAAKLCVKALEMLRRNKRGYYLIELTDLLDRLWEKGFFYNSYDVSVEKYKQWADMFGHLCEEYDISPSMSSSAYIFVETGACEIGSVIRKRRKMFGMTQDALCSDICSIKTLNRIENGRYAMQDPIFKSIFEKLNLVPDYSCGEIITDSRKAMAMYNEIKRMENAAVYEGLEEKLDSFKRIIDMKVAVNYQNWLRAKEKYKLLVGDIDAKTYIKSLKEILNVTLKDYEKINLEDVYFTEAEIMLIHNYSIYTDRDDEGKGIGTAYIRGNSDDLFLMTHFLVEAFLIADYANDCGNNGEYEESNKISNSIIRMGLILRKVNYLSRNLYNNFWNDKQRGHIEPSALERCIQLADYCKNNMLKLFYESRLNDLS